MRPIQNEVMLITYADSMGRDLKELETALAKHFEGAVKGIHILPFFPSSGDRGFAVIEYDKVEPAFGDWSDIDRLAEKYTLAADFMLNHVSIRCREFKDYMEKGDASPYRNMFIHWNEFWPNGEPTEAENDAMYRRKPGGAFLEFTREDGKKVKLWNTFFSEQVDIDPYAKATQDYFGRNLTMLSRHVPLIRFDAFAYASKRPGTSCFFVEPDIWNVLDIAMQPLRSAGTQMLAEIHENYTIQLKMAAKGYWVYDFALPMLLLHGLYSGRTDRLIRWLHICPRNQFTTLDTHDGIGVVDVVDLLTDEEIDHVRAIVDKITEPAQRYIKRPSMIKMTGKQAQRYQLGCTYYNALDCNDDAYLLARAVQFFTPGIPQVYYVGMLAGKNDIEFLKNGGEGRGINRHNYSLQEVDEAAAQPVVQKLLRLMRFRNQYKVFDGRFTVGADRGNGTLEMTWEDRDLYARLTADFKTHAFQVVYFDPAENREQVLEL